MGEQPTNSNGKKFEYTKVVYPNPPDPHNPDVATLRKQWNFAIRQYSKWSSQVWGTAILAGVSFFAVGWFIKGGNPLVSRNSDDDKDDKQHSPSTS